MPHYSLEKTRYLKKKLDAAIGSVQIPPESIFLKEKIQAFEDQFKDFLDQLEETNPESLLPKEFIFKNLYLKELPLNRGDPFKHRFSNHLNNIKLHDCLEDQISRLTKNLIETLETDALSSELIEACRTEGIYQILYHHAVIGQYGWARSRGIFEPPNHGIIDEYNLPYQQNKLPPLGPKIIHSAIFCLIIAAAAVAFFAVTGILGLGGIWCIAATALFGSAVAYMSGLLYAITNDIFAAQANLPYFLLGHQATQYSFFISNDPSVQAIGWGVIASQPIAIVASLIFGIAIALVMTLTASPILTIILPIMMLGMPLLALGADGYARHSAEKYIKDGLSFSLMPQEMKKDFKEVFNLADDAETLDLDQIDFDSKLFRILNLKYNLFNKYQLEGLALMCTSKKDKANWLANSNRNLLGYIGSISLAIIGLVLSLSLSAFVPAVFLSPLVAVIIPTITAVIVMGLLLTALIYASANKDKQIDNRYKLFSDYKTFQKAPDTLYLNEEQLESALQA